MWTVETHRAGPEELRTWLTLLHRAEARKSSMSVFDSAGWGRVCKIRPRRERDGGEGFTGRFDLTGPFRTYSGALRAFLEEQEIPYSLDTAGAEDPPLSIDVALGSRIAEVRELVVSVFRDVFDDPCSGLPVMLSLHYPARDKARIREVRDELGIETNGTEVPVMLAILLSTAMYLLGLAAGTLLAVFEFLPGVEINLFWHLTAFLTVLTGAVVMKWCKSRTDRFAGPPPPLRDWERSFAVYQRLWFGCYTVSVALITYLKLG